MAHWHIEGIGLGLGIEAIGALGGIGATAHLSIGALAHWRIVAWLRAHPYPKQVAEQLVSLGTLEAVELMGLGYPVRIPYDDVRRRYASRLSAS